jgi:hypothetical protein
MQWLIDILGLICLGLAGTWVWLRKKRPRVAFFCMAGFLGIVVIAVVLSFFKN